MEPIRWTETAWTETANHLVWDLAFLGSGVGLIVVGWLILRGGNHAARTASIAGRQASAT